MPLLDPPGAFDLLLPADGASVDSLLPLFTARVSPDAATYRLEVTSTFGHGQPAWQFADLSAPDLLAPSFQAVVRLNPAVVYAWRFVAVNESGETASDSVRTFTTPDVPPPPTLYWWRINPLEDGSGPPHPVFAYGLIEAETADQARSRFFHTINRGLTIGAIDGPFGSSIAAADGARGQASFQDFAARPDVTTMPSE